MLQLTVVKRDGEAILLSAEEDLTLLEAIQAADIDEIEALCGGSCACATCHVFVGSDWQNKVGKMGGEESEILEFSDHFQTGSRLACQVKISHEHEGMIVTIAPEE